MCCSYLHMYAAMSDVEQKSDEGHVHMFTHTHTHTHTPTCFPCPHMSPGCGSTYDCAMNAQMHIQKYTDETVHIHL